LNNETYHRRRDQVRVIYFQSPKIHQEFTFFPQLLILCIILSLLSLSFISLSYSLSVMFYYINITHMFILSVFPLFYFLPFHFSYSSFFFFILFPTLLCCAHVTYCVRNFSLSTFLFFFFSL